MKPIHIAKNTATLTDGSAYRAKTRTRSQSFATAPMQWKDYQELRRKALKAIQSKGIFRKDLCGNTRVLVGQQRLALFYLWITVQGNIGLRASSIFTFRWYELLQDQGEIIVVSKKTSKEHSVYVNPTIRKTAKAMFPIIRPNLDENALVFANPKTGEPYSLSHLNKTIKQCMRELGIKAKKPSSHTFRKTFALRFLEQAKDINDYNQRLTFLQTDVFKHNDLNTTIRYMQLNTGKIRDVFYQL